MQLRPEDPLRRIHESLRGTWETRIGHVKITSAQLLALRATPITVVPAPFFGGGYGGVGYTAIPSYAVFQLTAGTAYTVAADRDLALRYTNGSGNIIVVLESTGFLDQATVQQRVVCGFGTAGGGTPAGAVVITPTENAAIVLHNVGAAELTGGTGNLYVDVYGYITPTTFTY